MEFCRSFPVELLRHQSGVVSQLWADSGQSSSQTRDINIAVLAKTAPSLQKQFQQRRFRKDHVVQQDSYPVAPCACHVASFRTESYLGHGLPIA